MKNIIKALVKNLKEDNFEKIDNYYDFLQEVTLYSELREQEYKDEALKLIDN